MHPLAKACKIETGLHTKPYEIQKTRSEIDFACAFSALRIWQTRRFLRSSRKKCCLFDGIIRDIFLHTWSSPVILREFIYIGGFPKYFILYRVTEKQRFVQIYECYLLFENAEKSKFTFFYRTFSLFRGKSSTSIVRRARTIDLFSIWNILSRVRCFASYYYLFYLLSIYIHIDEMLWKNRTDSFFR